VSVSRIKVYGVPRGNQEGRAQTRASKGHHHYGGRQQPIWRQVESRAAVRSYTRKPHPVSMWGIGTPALSCAPDEREWMGENRDSMRENCSCSMVPQYGRGIRKVADKPVSSTRRSGSVL